MSEEEFFAILLLLGFEKDTYISDNVKWQMKLGKLSIYYKWDGFVFVNEKSAANKTIEETIKYIIERE